ncbi:hypothetical protein CF319_g9195 [Tilletia indica]|nr:hypothetical protein CF319_g9195 [Tilletia indica]
MSSNGKHTREEDALDAPRKTRATSKARADIAPALDSSSTGSGVQVGRDLIMTASSMSVSVHETYQTAPKAQPAVLSLLAGIKSLAEYTAQQDKVQSGLDRTLTATRAEVDTAREEAETAREEAETAREEAETAHQLHKTHEATIAQLRQQLEAERRNSGDERARFLAVQETKAAIDQELTETKAKLERVFEQIDKIRREQGPR